MTMYNNKCKRKKETTFGLYVLNCTNKNITLNNYSSGTSSRRS